MDQSDECYDGAERRDAKEASRELADWEARMTEKRDEGDDQNPPVRLPEDEAEAVAMVAESRGEEWAEEHRELIIAQAELIGDL